MNSFSDSTQKLIFPDLDSILQTVQDLLQAAAQNEALILEGGNVELVSKLGTDFDFDGLRSVLEKLSSNFPKVEVSTSTELENVEGVYIAELDTIYLTRGFLNRATEEQVVAVLLEQIGYAIDGGIHDSSSLGAETRAIQVEIDGVVYTAEVNPDNSFRYRFLDGDRSVDLHRTMDGSGNNLANPDWGAVGSQLLRLSDNAYGDGQYEPRGGYHSNLPSARAISNTVSAQPESVLNSFNVTDWFWQWGQFLDHDIDLTESAKPAEPFNITVPTGDPYFDPFFTGTQEIRLNRSIYDPDTGTVQNHSREQINEITAYIDASNVYGSDVIRASALRSHVDGKLLTTLANGEILLPYNLGGLPNAGGHSSGLFLAGDVRANEQMGLTAVHTLFVREHNRLAESLKARLVNYDSYLVDWRDAEIHAEGNGIHDEDDFIYHKVREVLGAQMQIVTYGEFLPLVLGHGALEEFDGYDDTVNPGIANEFSTAAYRFGHTMLSPWLIRMDNDNDVDKIALRDSFFNPNAVKQDGVDSLLKGLAVQQAQEIDTLVIDDVRNFLFGPPGSGGFDLASLNIQRGRDHGIGSLNTVREALGLTRHDSFDALTGGDVGLAIDLASVYGNVDDVDLWVGGLAEPEYKHGMLGETFHAIVKDQFERLRDGDRFFFLNSDRKSQLLAIDKDIFNTKLSDIILRNTSIASIQENVFISTDHSHPYPMSMASNGSIFPRMDSFSPIPIHTTDFPLA